MRGSRSRKIVARSRGSWGALGAPKKIKILIYESHFLPLQRPLLAGPRMRGPPGHGNLDRTRVLLGPFGNCPVPTLVRSKLPCPHYSVTFALWIGLGATKKIKITSAIRISGRS